MTGFEIVTLYTGLFVLFFIGLKINAGRVRASEKVNFGEGSNEAMRQAMRVQGNAVEDVPVTLIGLYGLAALSAPSLLLHGLGASFVIFRILHAVTLGGKTGSGPGRLIGTLGTLIVMIVTGGACIYFAVT